MNFDLSCAQLQGGRENQEDRYAAHWVGNGDLILLVCDGLGGHAHGDLAAQEAIATASRVLRAGLTRGEPGVANLLRQAFVEGHQAVCGIERSPYERPPATTMVAAILSADREELHLANAGDSISLIARGNEIRGIAEWQQDITYVLGVSLGSDNGGGVEIVSPQPLQVGDRILLASDGLEGFDRQLILECLARDTARQSCEALVRLALATSTDSSDNITIVVVTVGR